MTTDIPDGQRLAKAIARAGLASRRDAERMIVEGRVKVNGKPVDSPALNVGPQDRVTVDGAALPQAEGARLWLYHKPAGLVTTERDEKDRETVFDALRDRLGRVLSVGRLDLTSEGLLLLTNDGDLKRRLELPETGWLRRYRVRVNGRPDEAALQRLRDGITVEGEHFGEMQVSLDRQKGANAWLTVGLREGRNREVRRAAEAVGLVVNRLIRVSYGPFQLGTLAAGEVEEIKPRVLRDQIGTIFDGEFAEERREAAPRHAGDRLMDKGRGKPGAKAPRGGGDGPRKGAGPRADKAGARPDKPRTGKPPVTRNDGAALGHGRRDAGDGPRRSEGGKPSGDKPRGDRPNREGDKPRREAKPFGDRPRRAEGGKPAGDKPRGDRPRRDEDAPRLDGKPFGDRPKRAEGGKPWGGDKPRGDRPRRDEDAPRLDGKPFGDRPKRAEGGKPWGGDKPRGDRPRREGEDAPRREGKPFGDRPRRAEDGKPAGDRPRRNEGGKPLGAKPRRAEGGKPFGDKPRRAEGTKSFGDRPRRGDGPKTDGARPGLRSGDVPDAPRQTKTERKAAMRADTSVSLRKGGQRGRGISKPKPVGGKPFTRPTKPKS